MNKENYIATAEESLFHVYNRFPVVFEIHNNRFVDPALPPKGS